MKPHTKAYLLPDRTPTRSVARYVREWNRLSKPVAKALACRVVAVDPGILLSPLEGGVPITLSVGMARRIVELAVKANRA